MSRWAFLALCGGLLCLMGTSEAAAQSPPGTPGQAAPPLGSAVLQSGQTLPGLDASRQWHLERVGPNHWKLTGDVEIEKDDVRLFADEMEVFTDTNTLTARGNVVFSTATHRVSADSVEFNYQTKLGTFHNASGSAEMGEPAAQSKFGALQTDVYFYGVTLEKIGERKYRVTDGGFTSCVQPKPRWQLTSGTFILNLDHYAVMMNGVMRVKGVPVMYIPIMYYPINKEGRSTGFLMPVYGTSTLRGQTISNEFFWAINRSHDLALTHNWFSKTGQGYGTEYRYVASGASAGNVAFDMIKEKPTTTTSSTGTTTTVAGQKGFRLTGNVTQALPLNLKGRVRLDYFSQISIQQTYNTSIAQSTTRQRYYGGNLSGTWGAYSLSSSADRTEVFYSTTSSTASGNMPRVSLSRAERPIPFTPAYLAVSGEFVGIERKSTSGTTVTKLDVRRFDGGPSIRLPFTRWSFLTANTSATWRFTWWDKSKDPSNSVLDEPVTRSYYSVQSQIVGPVFNKIWNPGNGYAEKIKHTIEPSVTIQRVSSVDNYSKIVKIDGTDSVVGDMTRVTYALTNRVYAKGPAGTGQRPAKEIFNLAARQTYYTDATASLVDSAYSSSYSGTTASKFSAISVTGSAMPFESLSGSVRLEYDPKLNKVKTIGLQTSWSLRNWITTSASWNKVTYYNTLVEPPTVLSRSNYASGTASLRLLGGKLGSDVSASYNVELKYFLQKRIVAYYNAQCCGVVAEYQVYDYSAYNKLLGKDTRFNISFTLAGLGTFSNIFGAFGGDN
jgi:LPS-assembly protein